MPIVNRVADLHDEITAWRRDLHAHPELLYDVHRTAASVADKLKAFGCDEVVSGIGRTGELFAYQRSGVTPFGSLLLRSLVPSCRKTRMGLIGLLRISVG